MSTIYLAGGMRSKWQDRVIAACPQHTYLDPRTTTGLVTEDDYTEWDLNAIRASDVVFAYMDTDNPSGFGLCLEVGYARALNKTVLYVCEDTSARQKYFGMVRCCSNVTFAALDDGIAALIGLAPARCEHCAHPDEGVRDFVAAFGSATCGEPMANQLGSQAESSGSPQNDSTIDGVPAIDGETVPPADADAQP